MPLEWSDYRLHYPFLLVCLTEFAFCFSLCADVGVCLCCSSLRSATNCKAALPYGVSPPPHPPPPPSQPPQLTASQPPLLHGLFSPTRKHQQRSFSVAELRRKAWEHTEALALEVSSLQVSPKASDQPTATNTWNPADRIRTPILLNSSGSSKNIISKIFLTSIMQSFKNQRSTINVELYWCGKCVYRSYSWR